ncbi:MAG: hypothetical protein ACRD0U_01845 [Acidimicrobiales bacterium]
MRTVAVPGGYQGRRRRGARPGWVSAGDFNGDGVNDIAVSGTFPTSIPTPVSVLRLRRPPAGTRFGIRVGAGVSASVRRPLPGAERTRRCSAPTEPLRRPVDQPLIGRPVPRGAAGLAGPSREGRSPGEESPLPVAVDGPCAPPVGGDLRA